MLEKKPKILPLFLFLGALTIAHGGLFHVIWLVLQCVYNMYNG
jgi:hypothetical protein